VSAASGPNAVHSGNGARGRLYRWDGAWRPLALPRDTMPYALAAADNELVVRLANGRILRSGDRGESWDELGVRVEAIVALAA
jgi:hypothetical protein